MNREQIWECKIGGIFGGLEPGSDAPMRAAVKEAFYQLTGLHAEFTFSGWGARLTPTEREVIESRRSTNDAGVNREIG